MQCDVSESNLEIIFKLGNVSKASFTEMIWADVERNTSKDFFQHLQVDPECLEARIYRAATKVSTLLELKDIRNLIAEKDYLTKKKQLNAVLKEFSDLPCYEQIMSDPYQEIFRNFSKLRNRIRWAKHPNIVQCSVLGHMFDVACFAYLMSMEVAPYNEALATQYFFMGIFHDFPECWTGDMPSPIKDALPGLRKATEEYENMVMEENVYSHLPLHMASAIRSVMLETDENAQYKAFLKKSDNFSAYVECWREIDAGSHHSYYKNVIRDDYHKKEALPHNFRRLMEELHDSCHN
jgi:5'-deoxynucleotidase YfbR-like HD superfamily hydrolase